MAGPLGWVLAELEAEKAQLKEEAAPEATEAEQAHRAKVRDVRQALELLAETLDECGPREAR
jgi:hypothetical protein